eukprot:15450704-Alexandrium_andersonii.AAC.1
MISVGEELWAVVRGTGCDDPPVLRQDDPRQVWEPHSAGASAGDPFHSPDKVLVGVSPHCAGVQVDAVQGHVDHHVELVGDGPELVPIGGSIEAEPGVAVEEGEGVLLHQ